MKKIIALVLSVLVLCTLSVSAFAKEKSPENPEKQISITIRAAIGVEGVTKVDAPAYIKIEDAKVTVKADPARGDFNGFKIYKKVEEKFVEATQGEDYDIIKGDLNAQELQIQAKTDLVICANYNGQVTDPAVPAGDSPKTADNAIVFAAIALLAAAAVVFSAKKVTE